jgi:hypothetical protein
MFSERFVIAPIKVAGETKGFWQVGETLEKSET